MNKAKVALEDWQKHIDAIRDEANAKYRELEKELGRIVADWQERFDEAEHAYRSILAELDKDGVGLQVLSERRKGIQDKIDDIDGQVQELNSNVLPELIELGVERDGLLTELQEHRRAITNKREEKAVDLSKQLGQKIRLRVHARANPLKFERALGELARGSYLKGEDISTLAKMCHPIPFVKRLLASEFDELGAQSGLEAKKLEKLFDTVVDRNRTSELFDLQSTDVDDVIEVQLKVSGDSYRSLKTSPTGKSAWLSLWSRWPRVDFHCWWINRKTRYMPRALKRGL